MTRRAPGYRILITGSRYMRNPLPIRDAFLELHHADQEMLLKQYTVVHGAGPGEPGCDALVNELFRKEFPEVAIEPHPPVPQKFGPWPAAGPRRNSYMVGLGADICLAFPCPRSRGTRDCYEKAIRAGIPTRVWLVKP